jgi:transcriptional regulator with XRE-family HTH domain
LPFCNLRLNAPRPRALPRGYPTEVKTLGDHIRRRRLDLGLLQRTVAEKLGVRVDTVTLWENGRVRPLPRHFGPIVRFLGYDPEPGDRSLAGRLRAARRRLGLSQADFAARVGLDEGSVCRWEGGSRRPSRWMASRVAVILDRLESATGAGSADAQVAPPPLTYFDRTRWRRRPPPDLTDGGPISLGDRIRHHRLELGLSQEQLGRRLGVGRNAIRQWERGKSVPHGSRRDAVLDLLERSRGDGQ